MLVFVSFQRRYGKDSIKTAFIIQPLIWMILMSMLGANGNIHPSDWRLRRGMRLLCDS